MVSWILNGISIFAISSTSFFLVHSHNVFLISTTHSLILSLTLRVLCFQSLSTSNWYIFNNIDALRRIADPSFTIINIISFSRYSLVFLLIYVIFYHQCALNFILRLVFTENASSCLGHLVFKCLESWNINSTLLRNSRSTRLVCGIQILTLKSTSQQFRTLMFQQALFRNTKPWIILVDAIFTRIICHFLDGFVIFPRIRIHNVHYIMITICSLSELLGSLCLIFAWLWKVACVFLLHRLGDLELFYNWKYFILGLWWHQEELLLRKI